MSKSAAADLKASGTAHKRRFSHSRSYTVRDDGKVDVFNLDFAAYCMLCGLPIADMVEIREDNRPIKYIYTFYSDTDNECGNRVAEFSVGYVNSESARHADCVRRLKTGARSTTRYGGR